jgi:hypothetical protein
MWILKCSHSILKAVFTQVKNKGGLESLSASEWNVAHKDPRSLPAEDLYNQPYAVVLSDLRSPAKQKLMWSLWIWGSLFCSSFISSLQNLYSNRKREEGDKSGRRAEWENGRGVTLKEVCVPACGFSAVHVRRMKKLYRNYVFLSINRYGILNIERRNLPTGRTSPAENIG